jgi:Flp pilus assembly pilin Flp
MRSAELIGASPLVHARIAGLVAVVMLASGSFTGFVSSGLVVRGDATATSSNLARIP